LTIIIKRTFLVTAFKRHGTEIKEIKNIHLKALKNNCNTALLATEIQFHKKSSKNLPEAVEQSAQNDPL